MLTAIKRISNRLDAMVPSLPVNYTARSNDWQHWFDMFTERGYTAASGELVNVDSALSIPAFWQAVSLISGDVAKLPLYKYKRLEDDDRERVKDRDSYLINREPTKGVPAFEVRRRSMVHATIWQRAYLWRRKTNDGRVLEHINLLPDRTWPDCDEQGNLYYVTQVGEAREEMVLLPSEVIDIMGLSVSNHKHINMMRKIQDEIGLALARRGFASAFYARGAGTGGVLQIPPTYSEKAARNLEEGFRKRSGRDEWFKVAILRDGAKFHQTTRSFQESQVKEMTEDEIRAVAQFFCIPPVKLGLPSDSYKSVEMLQRFYLDSCLSHWLHAEAGAYEVKCLGPRQLEYDTHFMEHNVSKLLETDMLSMAETMQIYRQMEVLSPNEIRRKINYRNRTDPEGDDYSNPNTKSSNNATAPQQPPDQPSDQAEQNLLRHGLSKLATRVSREVKRAKGYAEWEATKADCVRDVFRRDMRPVADVVGGGAETCDRWERDFFDGVRSSLQNSTNLSDDCRRMESELPSSILLREN